MLRLQTTGCQTSVTPVEIRKDKTIFFVEEPKIIKETEVAWETPFSALAYERRSVSYIEFGETR